MIPPVAVRLLARPGPVHAGGSRWARGWALLLVSALLALVCVGPLGASAAAAPVRAAAGDEAPLRVTIESLSPSTLPRRGDVTVTGEVVNDTESTWTDLNVYLFSSATPMTTSAQLATATATDPALEVGERITDEGLYDRIEELAPGERAGYVITVPRSALPAAEGVHWLGVHVLGSNDEGRLPGADGRARTFIASVDERRRSTSLSLVMPLKATVRRLADGRVANVPAWIRMLGPEGHLGRLLALSSDAGPADLTWVVDPAVVDAVHALSVGNPGLDMGPTAEGGEDPPDPSASPSEPPAGTDRDEGPSPEDIEVAELASSWLASFREQAPDRVVMRVPYGDVDLAAAARADLAGVNERATEASTQLMEQLAVPSSPIVAPTDLLLPGAALDAVDPQTPLLLSQEAVAQDADGASVLRTPQGHVMAVSSPVARIGGPPPTTPHDALVVRQQILAEAAVHALGPAADEPLVVTTPERWNPGDAWRSGSFFGGLDVPWLDLVGLRSVLAAPAPTEHDGQLRYPRAERRAEIPVENLLATQQLTASGSVLAELLDLNDTIDEQVTRAALLGASTSARPHPDRALTLTRAMGTQVRRQLSRVSVEASPIVTMSSGTGTFAVTVVNRLDEPVTVGLAVETDTDDLAIELPDTVSLGPGQRASVRLGVTASGTGVHSVRIRPTTSGGRGLGTSTEVRVRSSQVGLVIWLITGAGAAVFVATIAVRILRRVRSRRKTHGPLLKDARR